MNQSEAAQLLSVTSRTLNLWASEEPPIPCKRISQTELNYDASEIVRWYAAHEVTKALRATENRSDEREVAETRDALAKAELREIELAKVKGALLPAADVEREQTRLVLIIRQALLNVPHQVSVAFEDGLSYSERKEKAQKMIDTILRGLADPGTAPDAEEPAPVPASRPRRGTKDPKPAPAAPARARRATKAAGPGPAPAARPRRGAKTKTKK
jgi:phage terminase Nu1 subunit (DNA packaging protein)